MKSITLDFLSDIHFENDVLHLEKGFGRWSAGTLR
jgi:hypothetical protein